MQYIQLNFLDLKSSGLKRFYFWLSVAGIKGSRHKNLSYDVTVIQWMTSCHK